MRHGFLRFALVGIIATRIGRMTRSYADFPALELTWIKYKSPLLEKQVNSKAENPRKSRHPSNPRCYYSDAPAQKSVSHPFNPCAISSQNPCAIFIFSQ